MNSQLIVALLLLVINLVTRTCATECPFKDPTQVTDYVQFKGKCFYYLGKEFAHMDIAEEKCKTIGTELVELPGEIEGSFIMEKLVKKHVKFNKYPAPFSGFWIQKDQRTQNRSSTDNKCPLVTLQQTKCPVYLGLKLLQFCQFDCDKENVSTVCQWDPNPKTTTTPRPTTPQTTEAPRTSPTSFRPYESSDDFGLPISTSTARSQSSAVPTWRVFPTEILQSATSNSPTEVPTTKLDLTTEAYVPSSIRTSIKRGVTSTTTKNNGDEMVLGCPQGFRLAEDRCYKLYKLFLSGSDIKIACMQISAKPAAVVSSAVHATLVELLKESQHSAFIGGHRVRSAASSSFAWSNESDRFDTNRWDQGEPDPSRGDCILMDVKSSGKWKTYPCNDKAYMFCETNAILVPRPQATTSTNEAPKTSMSMTTTTTSTSATSDSSTDKTSERTEPIVEPDSDGNETGHPSGTDAPSPSNKASVYASFILLAILILFLLLCLIMKFRSKKRQKGVDGSKGRRGNGREGQISLSPKPNDPTCYEEKCTSEKIVDETESKLLRTGGSSA